MSKYTLDEICAMVDAHGAQLDELAVQISLFTKRVGRLETILSGVSGSAGRQRQPDNESSNSR